MKDIGIVITVICVSALICSIVNTVAPQGATGRILNTVLGVFIICALIAPVKNAVSNFELNTKNMPESKSVTASADELFENQVLRETEKNLSKMLKKLLDDEKLQCNSFKINLKTDSGGGIYIESISIYINKNSDTQRISNKVIEKFEMRPRIIKE